MSKAKTLKRGDAWTTKDRLWAVVNRSGAILQIINNRKDANAKKSELNKHYPLCGAMVVRLGDLSGIVQ